VASAKNAIVKSKRSAVVPRRERTEQPPVSIETKNGRALLPQGEEEVFLREGRKRVADKSRCPAKKKGCVVNLTLYSDHLEGKKGKRKKKAYIADYMRE